MDITMLLIPFIKPFIYFVIFSIIVAVLTSPWFKGRLGEFKVNLLLRLFLDKTKYHLIKDVTLPVFDESGQNTDSKQGTTQIDHIVVSQFGVFVIETKHFKGWIFGSEFQKKWTQQIYRHKSKFQNPLLQNYKHCKTLESLLGLASVDAEPKTQNTKYKENSIVKSLVVFTGSAEFKTDMPASVCYDSRLIKAIKSFQTKLLDIQQVAEIIEQIESGRLKRGFVTNKQHKKHVKELVTKKLEVEQRSGYIADSQAFKQKTGKQETVKEETGKQGAVIQKPVIQESVIQESVIQQPEIQKVVVAEQAELKADIEPRCPKCGSGMVRRQAKSGKFAGVPFFGCSGFPKCRGLVRV